MVLVLVAIRGLNRRTRAEQQAACRTHTGSVVRFTPFHSGERAIVRGTNPVLTCSVRPVIVRVSRRDSRGVSVAKPRMSLAAVLQNRMLKGSR